VTARGIHPPATLEEEAVKTSLKRAVVSAAVLALVVSVLPAAAQDAVKADPKHYKVVFENDQVRVLHITYGPGEKSVMHGHPANVAVFLTDGLVRFATPDGKSQDVTVKAHTTQWDPGGAHLPANMGDKPFSVMLVELKAKAPAGK
jgi:quercetin dioxygenase-like cupin family protein